MNRDSQVAAGVDAAGAPSVKSGNVRMSINKCTGRGKG